MTTKKLRVAIIGAGGIGKTHQAAYATWPAQCEIVAVVDVVEAAAMSLAQTAGATAFTDYAQMMNEIAPDALSICTPPHEHLPIAQAAAERGIHALCEKPPARTLAETQSLVDAFDDSNAILQFAFCHRFHQPIQQAQELIASGKLGDIVHIDNRFAFRFDGVERRWFTDPNIAGGGIILDTLVHSVDIFRALAGEIATVQASATNRLAALQTRTTDRVEDTASLLVTSESGVLGTLSCSWATALPRFSVTIFGTQGEVLVDYANEGGVQYRLADDETWSQMDFDAPNRFAQQAKHFLRCITTGEQPLVGGADGLAVMRVLDEAYRQIK